MEEIDHLLGSKIWKIKIATYRYGDVFEQYYKVCDSLQGMKEEIESVVEKIEEEKEEDEKEMSIGNMAQMEKNEEARKKEKEKIASFYEEYTKVSNTLTEFHSQLCSISGALEELANIINPNHDIEF